MNLNDTELTILAALLPKPLYGFALVEEVERISDGRVKVTLGGVYPLLHKMESKGLIKPFWGDESEIRAGARRRYYLVTGLGQQAFENTRQMLMTAARKARLAYA